MQLVLSGFSPPPSSFFFSCFPGHHAAGQIFFFFILLFSDDLPLRFFLPPICLFFSGSPVLSCSRAVDPFFENLLQFLILFCFSPPYHAPTPDFTATKMLELILCRAWRLVCMWSFTIFASCHRGFFLVLRFFQSCLVPASQCFPSLPGRFLLIKFFFNHIFFPVRMVSSRRL